MLESTLSKLMKNLKKKHSLTDYQVTRLSHQLSAWEKGTIVYPSALKSKLNTEIKFTYEILEFLLNEGVLERNYELYCYNCKKFKGKIVKTITDIPIDCTCDFCNDPINPLDDAIVVYRVVLNE